MAENIPRIQSTITVRSDIVRGELFVILPSLHSTLKMEELRSGVLLPAYAASRPRREQCL
jgi:hypothetical protein